MSKFTMTEIYSATHDAGDVRVQLAVYYPDLGEDGNDLPALYQLYIGANETWEIVQGSPETVIDKAVKAFEEAIEEAEYDYHQSGRARDDYRLMVAGL